MKHTEVPHELDNLKISHKLEHGDKIIYCAIRKYMNKDSRECFPAIPTIALTLQCSENKIKRAITRLIESGLIQKSKNGRKNCYYFPKTEFDRKFEMFTDEFVKMDLPLNLKEYYMDIQQYLYDKESGIGKCSFSNAELSRRTGWTIPTVKKYNLELIERNLLQEDTTENYDETGLPIVTKKFDLQALNQAALWAQAITKQVVDNTEAIEEIQQRMDKMEEDYKKEIARLQKELSKARNTQEIYPESFDF